MTHNGQAKELESRARVRFQDCDPFGHLNNARYIDYFFNAREDHMAAYYDFHIFAHGQQTGQNWVVSKSQIAYLAPAFLDEEVVIRMRLIYYTENVLVIEGLMFDAKLQYLKAVAWMEFTYVNLSTGRPAQHEDDLMDLFGAVVVDESYDTAGFVPRADQLRALQRQMRHAQQAQAVAG